MFVELERDDRWMAGITPQVHNERTHCSSLLGYIWYVEII